MKSAPPRASTSRKSSGSKPKPATSKKAAPAPPPPSSPPAGPSDDDSDEDESSDDEEFISEDTMAKLLEALGPEGVKEALAELNEAMGGEGEGSDDEDDDEFEDAEGELSEDDVGEIPLAELADLSAPEESDDEEEDEEDENDMELEDDEEEQAGVALDELDDDESEVDEDAVPYQKVTIFNKHALNALHQRIHAPYVGMQWSETMVVTASSDKDPMHGVDPTDDLTREVAFYKQALDAANQARTLAAKDGMAFSRPNDYYAEMVKADAHMERIRQRLLDESSGIKKSEDARKQRDLKKFGKKVQTAKLQEREGERKALDDRLKTLKRKRKDGEGALGGGGGDDDFDVKLEEAITARPGKISNRGGSERGGRGSKITRQGRDSKFGFGSGGGRYSKSNTKESTEDMSDFNGGGRGRGGGRGGRGGRGGGRGGRGGARGGGAPREGKSKRMHSRRK